MMSSMPCRSSVPGAIRAIELSRRGSRRGSCSEGERVNPRLLPVRLSRSLIKCGPDRSPYRVQLLHLDLATRRRAGRSEDRAKAELRALIEPPVGLRGRAEPPGEADLAER